MLLFNSCEYFYHAARLGNLTAAANEINISQSALSKAILKLESELDCQLFFRNRRGVQLTPAGEILFEGVKRTLGIMDETVSRMQCMKKADFGAILIGSGDDLFSYYMLPIIKRYHILYPNIVIKEVSTASSEETLRNLAQDKIELGLVNKRPESDIFDYHPIQEMREVVLAGPQFAAIAINGPMTWKQLSEYPFILRPQFTHTRARFDAFMRDLGVSIVANYESGSTAIMLQMAAENLGLAVAPKEIAEMHLIYKKLKVVPLREALPSTVSYIAWRKNRKMSDCMRKLIDHILF